MTKKINHQNKVFATIAALCAVLAFGCKKLVEINLPHNTITSTAVFSTDGNANSVLSGLYTSLSTSLTIYAGMSSDELAPYTGVVNQQDYQFYTNTLQASNALIDAQIWGPQYNTIYNANSIVQGVAASTSGALTDSVRRQLVGEAKFIRAFSYFYLTNFFGDVPLVLDIDFHTTALLPRAPQSKIYAQIVQDLLDAQSTLPADYNVAASGERIRANKWTATALLARVYLYQKNWKDAETQASAIINNTTLYGLVTPLSNVFLKNSKEAIWQFKPSTATNPPYGIDSRYFLPTFLWQSLSAADMAAFLQPAFYGLYSSFLNPPYDLSPQMAAAFETGDQRKAVWTGNAPSPAAAPYNGIVTYYPYKYTQAQALNAVLTQYNMVLRVAEQYLIRAEARAQQNNLGDAASDINIIRSRAGLGATPATSQTDLLAAVAQERRVELFSEWGHRFFDLKRTGKASAVLSAIATKQPFSDFQLVYPIPPLELTNDPNMVQNPGY
jgi:hypothetical protein